MASRTKRISLWLTASCFLLVVLVLLALPWLYAWAVPYFMRKEGVTVQSVSHQPLKHLQLHTIGYDDPQSGVHLTIETIELPAFYPLVFGALSDKESKSAVRVVGWKLTLNLPKPAPASEATTADTAATAATSQLETTADTAAKAPGEAIAEAATEATTSAIAKATTASTPETTPKTATAEAVTETPTTPFSPAEQVLKLRELLYAAEPWLASITLERGSVNYGEYAIDLPLIHWQEGTLEANGTLPAQIGPFALQISRLSLPSPGLLATFELMEPEISGELRALVPYLDSSSLTAALSLQWKGGLAEANAHWSGHSPVPDSADFNASDFPVPAYLVSIPNYAQPLISLRANWQEGQGALHLQGHAESLSADKSPLDWTLEAQTDTVGIQINTLQMSGPWLNGELGEPIQLEWERLFMPEGRAPARDEYASPPAAEPVLRLVLDANLADFPFLSLQGRASGVLTLSTDAQGRARGDLSLDSSDLSWQSIRLESLRVQAALRGNFVQLVELDIRATDGSYFTGSGRADLSARRIEDAEFKGNITDPFVRALGSALPQGEHAEFALRLNGAWDAIEHAGQVRLNTIALSTSTEHFDAVLQWEGKAFDIPDIKLSAYGDHLEASIRAAFLRDETARTDRVRLESAYFQAGEYPAVTLEEPSVFTYNEINNTLELTPLKLTSKGQGYVHAEITLPRQGQPGVFSLNAAQISARWLEVYRGAQLPCPIGIGEIRADFEWQAGQALRGTFFLQASAEPGELPPVQFVIQSALDASGIRIEQISIGEADARILAFTGSLPLTIDIDEQNRPQPRLLAKEPLHASAELSLNNPDLSAWLEETFTLHLGALHASLTLGGTPIEPTGTASLALHSFSWKEPPGGLPPLPLIESLQVDGELTPEQIRLLSLNALLGNAPLIASAQLPFTLEDRRLLVNENKFPSFEKASASLATGDIPLRNFGAALPPMLRPMGFINIEAALNPGFDTSGTFILKDASTRPLPPVGSIDNISAEIRLQDRRLNVNKLDAQIGAQPVTISGTVDLAQWDNIAYDLALQGGDLPIVRSPGLILRAKPDITLKTDTDGTTTLAGSLELGSSFYTIDFTALTAPGGGGGASTNNRPPYFSVSEQPMADWLLNLRLHGDNFLRIRTPVFEGIASANFNLRGPLSAPYAFGNAEVDQGVILFPFATLRVEGGGLSLRQDDPYSGRLDMTAAGRAYGYDLRMHLTGSINDPNIQFDASPSLDQSEILMLLSTGQIPNAPERSTMSRLSGLGMFLGNNVLINLGLVDPLDERFELLIGEDVTESDQDTITVRYRLTDDWSVIGNYDRFDAYNLDLQWTIYRD